MQFPPGLQLGAFFEVKVALEAGAPPGRQGLHLSVWRPTWASGTGLVASWLEQLAGLQTAPTKTRHALHDAAEGGQVKRSSGTCAHQQ